MEMSDSQGLQMGNPIGKLVCFARVKVEICHAPKRLGIIEPGRVGPVYFSESGRSFEISSCGYINNL